MVLKKTSKEGFVFPRSENPKGAFLADFDIDGASLKKLHEDWLKDNVVDPAKAKRHTKGMWEIELSGRASKSGSDEHNMWLSEQRLNAVASHLNKELAGLPFRYVPRVLGESSPYDSGEYEHELDRSVEVTAIFRGMKPKPFKPRLLIPKVHPWKREVNRKVMDFTLQVLRAEVAVTTLDLRIGPLSIGNGDARVKMYIRIDEVGTPDYALFEYSGSGPGSILGASISLKKVKVGPGLSRFSAKYAAGKVHKFATDVEMDAADFAAPAFFKSDVVGRMFKFGPETNLFGPVEKIRDLSFGLTPDANLLKYAEATTFGEMKLVSSTPSWAE